MTLGQCIQRCDALRPNAFTEAEKAGWLLELEGEVEGFLGRYEGPRPRRARTWPEDRAMALLASGPFEELYVYRLLAHMELADREWDGYNAFNALANQARSAFQKSWHRAHRLCRAGR